MPTNMAPTLISVIPHQRPSTVSRGPHNRRRQVAQPVLMQVMAHVIPFHPWLYNRPWRSLDRLARRHDVISPDLQAELYQRSPTTSSGWT